MSTTIYLLVPCSCPSWSSYVKLNMLWKYALMYFVCMHYTSFLIWSVSFGIVILNSDKRYSNSPLFCLFFNLSQQMYPNFNASILTVVLSGIKIPLSMTAIAIYIALIHSHSRRMHQNLPCSQSPKQFFIRSSTLPWNCEITNCKTICSNSWKTYNRSYTSLKDSFARRRYNFASSFDFSIASDAIVIPDSHSSEVFFPRASSHLS